ncbi:hypothetical protein I4U23_010918 [Adineta vaga]|nr:hypothetical protein I4U23_010918 [Adineta vaga]
MLEGVGVGVGVEGVKEQTPTPTPIHTLKMKCSYFECLQILVGLFVSIAITIYTIIQTNNENFIAAQNHSKRKSYLIRCLYQNNLITHRLNDNSFLDLNFANLQNLNLNINRFIQTPHSFFSCVNMALAHLNESSFEYNQLSGNHFHHSLMFKVNLRATTIHLTYCDENSPIRTSFTRAFLLQSTFSQSRYYGIDFTYAIMNNSLLEEFYCYRCNFTEAFMIKCNLSYSKFQYEPINGYQFPKDYKASFIRTDLTDTILYRIRFERIDFEKAILIQTNATQATFLFCNLTNVIMNDCILIESQANHSNFILSNLNNCQMNRIQMFYVDFSHSYCYSCLFYGANLTGINFYNSSLDRSNFQNSIINREQLADARSINEIYL